MTLKCNEVPSMEVYVEFKYYTVNGVTRDPLLELLWINIYRRDWWTPLPAPTSLTHWNTFPPEVGLSNRLEKLS